MSTRELLVALPPLAHDGGISVKLLATRDLSTDKLWPAWEQCLGRTNSPNALFQSPAWFDHLHAIHPDRSAYVITVRDSGDQLVGVVPLVEEPAELAFSIGTRSLWTGRLQAVEMLGSEPLLEPNRQVYDQVFSTFEKCLRNYDAISISMVPVNSFFWKYLNEAKLINDRFIIYLADGIQRSRQIMLPSTFDGYLTKFSAKTRSQLRRRAKLLRALKGSLELKRYESVDDVSAFFDAAIPVVERSWQHACVQFAIKRDAYWQGKVRDLAERGLLRSYVLFCGADPCAVEFGYQFQGVFRRVQTHYDQSLAKHSPGLVLLYLYIQDLITYRRPRMLSFGYADAPYKAFFGNEYSDDAYVLLLRKNLANRVKKFSHSSFRSFVNFIKRRVRRTAEDA